ncbi:serine/threonine-protein kinase [Thermomonospora amylolytica]|uniref:serine/threonine-protein kinase n=1 Tax=Thermomonospora amylolytica TaxID=1411117 RepID=UPI0013008FB2|nr:serine/threonine-protein kinase [Thermomonospora amylolytica]
MNAKERSTLTAGVLPLLPADPRTVGGHRLLGRLGNGGMGLVYLGESKDPRGGLVAVKTLHPAHAADPEARRRFRDEAAHTRRIGSCCIARVIEDGSDRAQPYLVTEYIEGPPLSQVVQERGALPHDQVYAIALGVADALVAVHRAGVVHRDVKPSNVLLAADGPRIIDFGIAHPLEGAEGPTRDGVVMGSPGWIAPERLTGGTAGAACDVFGWGMLIAYAATGRHPFGEGDGEQLAHGILTLPPDLAGVREPLRRLVEAALAKDPALRPTAEDLLSALLKPCAEETAALAVEQLWAPPLPDPVPQAVVAPRHRDRRRAVTGLATAAVSLGAGTLAGFLVGATPAGDAGAEAPPRVEVTVTTRVPQDPARSNSSPDTPPAGAPTDDRPAAGPTPTPSDGSRTRGPRSAAPDPASPPGSSGPPSETTEPASPGTGSKEPEPTTEPQTPSGKRPGDKPGGPQEDDE